MLVRKSPCDLREASPSCYTGNKVSKFGKHIQAMQHELGTEIPGSWATMILSGAECRKLLPLSPRNGKTTHITLTEEWKRRSTLSKPRPLVTIAASFHGWAMGLKTLGEIRLEDFQLVYHLRSGGAKDTRDLSKASKGIPESRWAPERVAWLKQCHKAEEGTTGCEVGCGATTFMETLNGKRVRPMSLRPW